MNHRRERRRALVLLLVAACATGPHAGHAPADARDTVVATCETFLARYSARDFDQVEAMLAPHAIVVMDAVDADRQQVLPAAEFLARVRPALERADTFREWLSGPATVQVDAGIAAVWAPFEVEHDGERATGIDAFHLVKLDGAWRIASIAFTSRAVPR